MRQTPLRQYTPLRAKKGINKISVKQAEKNRLFDKNVPIKKMGICEKCGEYRMLSRHHKKRRTRGRDDSPENIQYLCVVCHLREDNISVVESAPQWGRDRLEK